DNGLVGPAELRLEVRRAVIDADPLVPRELGQRELAILHPARDNDRSRVDDAPVREADLVAALAVADEPRGAAGDGDLGSELLGLGERSRAERFTGDARRKTEVLIDLRAHA